MKNKIDFYVRESDAVEPFRLPPVTLTETPGQPIDLANAKDVRWYMRVNGGEAQEIDVRAIRETSRFTLPSIDVSIPGTVYEFEAEIHWGDGKIETVPGAGPFRVEVSSSRNPEIDDEPEPARTSPTSDRQSSSLLEDMITYAHLLADERERMGFVWTGDEEKDPRYMDLDPRCEQQGRVVWARDEEDNLFVLEGTEWKKISDEQWRESYPHAATPPHLPGSP